MIAPEAHYFDDAARILKASEMTYRDRGLASVPFGLALSDWLDLQ